MNRVTIRDVAREAGVSISAVSKAMNNSPEINEATREKILQVANKLNYIPNVNGRNLKARETKTIGLFVPSMRGRFYEVLTDYILVECEKNGYDLIAYFDKRPDAVVGRLLNQMIDGAIVMNYAINQDQIELMKSRNMPVVFLDREECNSHMSSILFNSYQDGKTAGKYLLSLGHRQFGFVMGPDNYYDSRMRRKGFEEAVLYAGGEIKEEHIWQGFYSREDSRRVISNYLEQGGVMPGAVFAVNDYSAIGCVEALRQHGVKVPEEVSVIGCDDIDVAEFLTPPLTTIRIPVESMGRMAVEQLLHLIRDDARGTIKQLEGNIIIRDSCYVKNNH